jgi:hypothetical protein
MASPGLVLSVALVVPLTACFPVSDDGATSRKRVTLYPSPTEKYFVRVYRHSGGGAAGWVEGVVSVTKSDGLFPRDEVIFKASGLHPRDIKVEWTGEESINIKYRLRSRRPRVMNIHTLITATFEEREYLPPPSPTPWIGALGELDARGRRDWHTQHGRAATAGTWFTSGFLMA